MFSDKFYQGNIKKFFEANSWDWHNDNLIDYGRVMMMHGFWGVKPLFLLLKEYA
jgi:uncharacterized membrane protein